MRAGCPTACKLSLNLKKEKKSALMGSSGSGRKLWGRPLPVAPGETTVPIMCCVTLDRLAPSLCLFFHICTMGSHWSPDLGPGTHRTDPVALLLLRQPCVSIAPWWAMASLVLPTSCVFLGLCALLSLCLARSPEARHDQKGSREGRVYSACRRRALWSL